MTGTPIQNNIGDFYSLLKFLRVKPYEDWSTWKAEIENKFNSKDTRSQKFAVNRLNLLMSSICIRRRKGDTLDNEPLVVLPNRHVAIETQIFETMDEKDFYKALETSSQLAFNRYLREGTVFKNYSNILVLLLRTI